MHNHLTPSWEPREIFLWSPRFQKRVVFTEITSKYQVFWLLLEGDRKEGDLFHSCSLNLAPTQCDLKETHHHCATWGTCIFRSCLHTQDTFECLWHGGGTYHNSHHTFVLLANFISKVFIQEKGREGSKWLSSDGNKREKKEDTTKEEWLPWTL